MSFYVNFGILGLRRGPCSLKKPTNTCGFFMHFGILGATPRVHPHYTKKPMI